jgi:hypothetical protein
VPPPPFLFHKVISFGILNCFHDFKKILSWGKKYYEFSQFPILKNFGMTEVFKIRKIIQNTNHPRSSNKAKNSAL